jgi:hypothetical protein
MSEQTSNPTEPAKVFTTVLPVDPARVQSVADRFFITARAMRFAIEVAKEAPYTARNAEMSPAHMFTDWQAVNLLLNTAFDAFRDAARDVLETMKQMQSPR